ncbi:MAG TPA: TldD/PmbA family protein, partial [Anaeromyxobacteraceae bacterium]|nr:TldD/PmbA family protein [Anaeromyxobacteraceae bacterium]
MRKAAEDAVGLAQDKGAHEVASGAYRVRNVEVQWRDGKLERVSEATTRGIGLELYVDGRYSTVSTSDLRPQALSRFIEDAVKLTRTLAPDPFRRLPDPKLYEGQAQVDLDLEDRSYHEVTPEQRRQMTEAIEMAARAAPGAQSILSVTTGCGDTLAETFRVHSNGFEGSRRVTDFWLSAQVSVKDPDGRRPEDWSAGASRHRALLPSAGQVGREAAERAIARIGSRKGESALLTLAVENRAAGRLIGYLLAALGASALQQKRSFLEGRRGEKVASPLFSLTDDPLLPRGLGSRLYDGEGLAARSFPVFSEGVLESYYVDTYYGRKLGMQPTTRGPSNLAVGLGAEDRPSLLSKMGEGVLVTGFLGGNSNSTTGDFSLGVHGFRVRAGQLA